jgi:signal transduction histidine kinase
MRILQSPQKNYVLLGIIAVSAVLLSIFSYEYSVSVADQILESSSDDIRSNAKVQTHYLSLILSNGLDSIMTNLKVLSNSRGIQDYDMKDTVLFDAAQKSTNELPDSYIWLDQNGKLLWLSGMNATFLKKQIGLDFSNMQFFIAPRNTHAAYYSVGTQDSKNNGPLWMYISFPVLDASGIFKGVVVSIIKFDLTADILSKQSLEIDKNLVILADSKGTIVYSNNNSITGSNVLKYGSQIAGTQGYLINGYLARSLQGFSDSVDIELNGARRSTIVSEPINYNGKLFWIVYVVAPYNLTRDVEIMLDQQNNFSSLMIIVIGIVAFSIATLIISWNKRLEASISSRTSELKRANDYLLAANDQLTIHDKMQKEFLNIASHEMKTPTQSILLHSNLLTTHPESTYKSIDAIVRNATRLQRLTYDILDVTRIESQTLKLNKEQFNLKDMMLSIIEEYNVQIDTGKINLVYNIEDILVIADKSRITQVISNLLSNAIKFTNAGFINISTQRKNDDQKFIVVSISDSGTGVEPEILPGLFSKFVTKSDMGIGLGLYISKNVIEAHGGKMWLSNNNANGRNGATFSFSLPISTDGI